MSNFLERDQENKPMYVEFYCSECGKGVTYKITDDSIESPDEIDLTNAICLECEEKQKKKKEEERAKAEAEAVKNCDFPFCKKCKFIGWEDDDSICTNKKSEFYECCVYDAETEEEADRIEAEKW